MGKHEELMAAIRRADVAAVSKLLTKSSGSKSKLMSSCKKLNLNQLDGNGLAALHEAAVSGHLELTQVLLEHGAAVDVHDSEGIRPLHLAVEGGHSEIVTCLMERGCNINEPSFDGTTPLHIACESGHLTIVQQLLEHAASLTTYNSSRKTPFDLACEFGHEQVVRMLLDDTDGLCHRLLISGDSDAAAGFPSTSCIHLAARNGHTAIVSLLLDAGCDVNRWTREGTALHEAVAKGHVDVVCLLLSHGADVTCINCRKQTALDVICRMPASRSNVRLRQLLQKAASTVSYTCHHQPSPAGSHSYSVCDLTCSHVDNAGGSTSFVHTPSTNEALAACHHCMHRMMPASSMACSCSNLSAHRPHCRHPSSPSTQIVTPDVVVNCPRASVRRPSEPAMVGHCGGVMRTHLPGLHSVIAPVRSATDLSQDCGSVVLHASFDADPLPPAPSCPGVQDVSSVHHALPMQRSQSPVDQIAEETAYQCRGGVGTDSPGSTSGTSSSGSSGYPASLCQGIAGAPANGSNWSVARQQHRLSGHSCESGVASFTSSRLSYLSVASGSSHDSINRLPEDDESAYASIVNFAELYENGYTESEIVRTWLCELRMEDCWELFDAAAYDMPTISRMTPEDLTAVGITQPVIRKRLTSEISKLHISDGIPNYIPDTVLEWLQQLQLAEYYDALTADGYYSDIDHVVEITWEDLEEIGIKKLGHQKKIMLAIDRLKKLKLAAKRSAQQNAELFQTSLLPAEQSCSMYEGHLTPSDIYRSSVKPCVGTTKSPSYFFAADSDSYRGSAQPWSVAPYQPEMVAIQVKRSANVQSPAVYDIPVASSAGYESFHGVPMRDASVGRVVSPYDDTSDIRMRRASGDAYVSTPFCASPYSMMTPPSCVGGVSAHLPSSRASAPSTPLHTASRLTPSTVTPKKIPPAPPQRTNSVKASGSPLQADTTNQHGSSQFVAANCGSLDRMSKKQSVDTARNIIQCSATTSTPATVMSTNVETGSTGDCSSLPFANENMGTIRQRGSLNSTSAARGVNGSDDDSEDKPVYDEYSGTVRRRVTGKKSTLQEHSTSTAVSGHTLCNERTGGPDTEQFGNSSEFTDIDNLFDGLTHELNELLTSAMDS